MSDRGPDSAGFAVYGPAQHDTVKLTLRLPDGTDADALLARLGIPDSRIAPRATHAVLSVPPAAEARARAALATLAPDAMVVGSGDHMELYKEVGAPADVARRFGARPHGRHARHRPHPHGHRVRRHHRRRASVLDRAGPVPGA